MRRIAIAVILTLAATAAFARGSYDGLSSAERCSGREVTFSDAETYVKKEIIDAGNLPSLKVSLSNAPIDVAGDSPSGYKITVCKAAMSPADLDRIEVAVENGELRTRGPSNDRWTVIVHVSAPRGANLDVEAESGPIALRDLDGKVTARTENGPLSLDDVSGTVEASTTNGPLSVNGSGGTMRLNVANGPLSVDLDGDSWRGSLEAATSNGPLSVRVPSDYASGVVIEARGHGPISCRAARCGRAALVRDEDGDWNEPRRFEFGSGAANVHLSTVNGPLTIKDE